MRLWQLCCEAPDDSRRAPVDTATVLPWLPKLAELILIWFWATIHLRLATFSRKRTILSSRIQSLLGSLSTRSCNNVTSVSRTFEVKSADSTVSWAQNRFSDVAACLRHVDERDWNNTVFHNFVAMVHDCPLGVVWIPKFRFYFQQVTIVYIKNCSPSAVYIYLVH